MEKENFKLETTRVYKIDGSLVVGKCAEEAIAVYRMKYPGNTIESVVLVKDCSGFGSAIMRVPVLGLDNTVQEVQLPKKKDFELVKNAVTDVDGNTYDGIRINGKLWMASNLRTTHFNNGRQIGRFASSDGGKKPYFEYPDVDKTKLNDYGLYYNFEAVNTGLLAPKGWHVPSKEEWEELFAFIAQHPEYNLDMDDKTAFGSHIAKAVCSKDGWHESSYKNNVGCEPEKNNSTGFNLFPAGGWSAAGATSNRVGYSTYLWSSSPDASSADNAWYVYTRHSYAYMDQYANTMANGRSVRCARNDQ